MGPDRIEIRGLRVLGRHGVLAHEQVEAQPFAIDLTIYLDLGDAERSDDLADTLDYGAVATKVSRIVGTRSFALIEALAGAIAAEVLADDRVHSVTVSVLKVRPPVPVDLHSAGVTVTRRRAEGATGELATGELATGELATGELATGAVAPQGHRVRAFLGLGSNLGDRASLLSAAIEGLLDLDPALVVSPAYETVPVGGRAGQGAFLNCVVALSTTSTPAELLARAQELERRAGRVRTERDAPRTLDVDVLFVEGYASDAPELTVPHPRMWQRAFVLAPLADIEPELAGEGWVDRLGGEEVVREAARRVEVVLDPREAPIPGHSPAVVALDAARPDRAARQGPPGRGAR